MYKSIQDSAREGNQGSYILGYMKKNPNIGHFSYNYG